MAELLASSVTLVVKAPNQKIDDQKVECTIDWTVNDLKQHLSKVYPTNPVESQQKIIYSGRLLQDNQRLKDILKQYEPDQSVHTIHLVCSASMSQYPSPTSLQTNFENNGNISLDGIRRRHPQGVQEHADTSGSTTYAYPPMSYAYIPHPAMVHYYSSLNPMTMSSVMPHHVAGFVPYGSHEWMQQAYAQSMMQYMQQYQQVVSQPHLMPQTSPIFPAPPADQNFPNEFPGAAAIEPEAPPVQPIGMNAHGGRDVDDGAERVNRDWLDTTYALVRLTMLMSILYFYSTPQRFLVTFVVAAMFYAYRVGWLRRARAGNQNRVPPANGAVPRNEVPPAAPQDRERPDDSEPEVTMINLQAMHRPSTFEFIWSIISSFFRSLIPENPGPMNAN